MDPKRVFIYFFVRYESMSGGVVAGEGCGGGVVWVGGGEEERTTPQHSISTHCTKTNTHTRAHTLYIAKTISKSNNANIIWCVVPASSRIIYCHPCALIAGSSPQTFLNIVSDPRLCHPSSTITTKGKLLQS